jgi:hypothetical protein
MKTTRVRVGSVVEWGIAAACIVAAFSLGAVALQEVRTIRAITPVMAGERVPIEVPPGIPSGSTAVPMLVLRGGTRLDVGERAADAAGKVNGWQVGADTIEHSATGDRVTRSYDDGNERFLLVIEPGGGSEPQVAAIYLQSR